MPQGTYLLSGHEGPYAVERFSCGPGPLGWRYAASRELDGAIIGRLDVVLDPGGVALRVEVATAGWVLRGGVVGGTLLWRRGDEERSAAAVGFTGTSPVWSVAAARAVPAGPTRMRLLHLGDEALGTRLVEQQWSAGPRELRDGVEVQAYERVDLATGEQARVQLMGDVVLAAPGVVLGSLMQG